MIYLIRSWICFLSSTTVLFVTVLLVVFGLELDCRLFLCVGYEIVVID